MRLYEGMFVIESALADRDWDGCCAEIDSIIAKHGGKVVDLRKWDERRLAYEIKHVRRGTYILVHFEAEQATMEAMRRDFNMSDKILRQLVLIDVDGVPSGDERPGITTSITDSSALGRRGRHLPRQTREGEGERKKDSSDGDSDKPAEPEGDAVKAEVDSDGSDKPAKPEGDGVNAEVDSDKPAEPEGDAVNAEVDSDDSDKPAEPEDDAVNAEVDSDDSDKPAEPDEGPQDSEDDSKDSN